MKEEYIVEERERESEGKNMKKKKNLFRIYSKGSSEWNLSTPA